MKKLIHFGPPLENHSHEISMKITGTFLAAIRLSAQLVLAAVAVPFACLLKTQICIGVKPMPPPYKQFLCGYLRRDAKLKEKP